MNSPSLQDIVRQHIHLPSAVTGRGWYSVRCLVCNDHKNKRRGGWKFEGSKTTYHCFNCNTTAIHDSDDGALSKEMRRILTAYAVPETEIRKLVLISLKTRGDGQKATTLPKIVKAESKQLILPPHFYRLGSKENDPWAEVAIEYLETRGMTPDNYIFYLSSGWKTPEDRKWKGRLIIPIYKNGKIIFYQGRDLTNSTKRVKYLGPSEEKNVIFYGYDEIDRATDAPIYIVEGFFDAFHIQGAAVLTNVLTDEQIKVLNKSRRPKVIIPDRRGDGHKLALQALDQGWSVSFPDIANCKDVNEAIVKYGKLYVQKSIVENTKTGFLARTMIELLCKKSENSTKTKK